VETGERGIMEKMFCEKGKKNNVEHFRTGRSTNSSKILTMTLKQTLQMRTKSRIFVKQNFEYNANNEQLAEW